MLVLTRKEWIDKGWIFKEDPLGWFQWYCRYSNGRRIQILIKFKFKDGLILLDTFVIKKNCERNDLAEDKDKQFFGGRIILYLSKLNHFAPVTKRAN